MTRPIAQSNVGWSRRKTHIWYKLLFQLDKTLTKVFSFSGTQKRKFSRFRPLLYSLSFLKLRKSIYCYCTPQAVRTFCTNRAFIVLCRVWKDIHVIYFAIFILCTNFLIFFIVRQCKGTKISISIPSHWWRRYCLFEVLFGSQNVPRWYFSKL